MFCFAEDNKIMSGIENTITEPDWKKTHGFSTQFRRLSGVVDRVTTYCLPLHYIYVRGCLLVVSLVSKFSEKYLNCLDYFYM